MCIPKMRWQVCQGGHAAEGVWTWCSWDGPYQLALGTGMHEASARLVSSACLRDQFEAVIGKLKVVFSAIGQENNAKGEKIHAE